MFDKSLNERHTQNLSLNERHTRNLSLLHKKCPVFALTANRGFSLNL